MMKNYQDDNGINGLVSLAILVLSFFVILSGEKVWLNDSIP